MSACDSNDHDPISPVVNTNHACLTSLENDAPQGPAAYLQNKLEADITDEEKQHMQDQEKQPVIDVTVQGENSPVVTPQLDTSLTAQIPHYSLAKMSKTDLKEATNVDGGGSDSAEVASKRIEQERAKSLFSSESPLSKADSCNTENATELDGNIDKSSRGNEVEKGHDSFISGRDNPKASVYLNAEDIDKNAFSASDASTSSQMASTNKNDLIKLKMLPENIQITDSGIVPGVADSMDLRISVENMSSSTPDQFGDTPLEKAILDHSKAEIQMPSSETSGNDIATVEIRSCIPSDNLNCSSLLDKKTVDLSQPETLNDSYNSILPQKSCIEVISSDTPSRISTGNETATTVLVCDTSKNEKSHLANSELQTSDEILKSALSHNAPECDTVIDNFQTLTSTENMLMITDVRSISNESMDFGPDNSDVHVIKDTLEEIPTSNTLGTSPLSSNMNTSDVPTDSVRADDMKDKIHSESTTCTAHSQDEQGVKSKESHVLISLLSNSSETDSVEHTTSARQDEQSRLEGTLPVSSASQKSILHKRIEQVDPIPPVNQVAIKHELPDTYETPTNAQPSMSYADRLKNIVDGCAVVKESRAGTASSFLVARNTQNKRTVQVQGRPEHLQETGQLQPKKDHKLSDGVKISVVTVGNCVNAPSSNSGAKPFLVVKNKTQPIDSTLKSTAGSNGSSVIPISTQVLPIHITPNTSANVLKTAPCGPNIRYLVPMNLIPTSVNQSGPNSTSASLPRSIQIKVSTPKPAASVLSNVSSMSVVVGTNTITAVHNDRKPKPLKPPAITTISTLSVQDKATHNTKNMPPLGAGTINIDSVGVSKITELISRKNPITIFKPPPMPSHLKKLLGENGKLHVCYECGDTFYFVDSLKQHQHRYSMKIRYKCETCNCFLIFHNKCQLLNHLRSHLNISKHMAVPIHIKSDSIQITTILSELGTDKPLQWFKEDPANLKLLSIDEKSTENVPSSNTKDTTSITTEHCDNEKQTQQPAVVKKLQITVLKPESLFSCSECKQNFPDRIQLQHHLQTFKSFTPCSRCDMFLPTQCAALLHAVLHAPHEVSWKACPECGMQFRDNDRKFFYHLKYECIHLSRIVNFPCSKCLIVNDSRTELKTHLMKRLEQYYKCGNCQMAFKSLKLYESHLVSKHGHLRRVKPKMLYRCHVCDTLIDDQGFLDDHTEQHVKQAATQTKFVWRCTECLKVFQKKIGLEKHLKEKLTEDLSKAPFNCKPCNLRFIRFDQAFTHWLTFHVRNSTYEVQFCQLCGLVCHSASALETHTCIDYVQIEKSDQVEVDKDNQAREQQGNTNNITSANMMTCCHCGLSCKSAASFAVHVRKHMEVDIFICKHCGKKDYNSYADLRNHEVVCGYLQKRPVVSTGDNEKQTKKRKISMSPRKSPKKLARLDASSTAEEQPFFMCEKCSKTFLWQDELDVHNKLEHGIHPCHLCGLTYESQNILQKHIKTSHEGKKHVYPCWVCRKRKIKKFFSDRARLEKHLAGKHRVHPDESMLVPEYPGLEEAVHSKSNSQKRKTDSSEDSPVKKLRVAGDGHFSCAKCTFSCMDRSEFLSHIKEHSVEKSVQCVECGLSFTVVPSLKKHLFMVHKVRDFEAYFKEHNLLHLVQESEDSVDIDKKDLIADMEAEKEKKVKVEKEDEINGNPLECNVCYKVFPNEAAIKSHMRVHGMAFIKAKRRALSFKGSELNKDQTSSPSSDGSGKEEEKATPPESKTSAGNSASTVEK